MDSRNDLENWATFNIPGTIERLRDSATRRDGLDLTEHGRRNVEGYRREKPEDIGHARRGP